MKVSEQLLNLVNTAIEADMGICEKNFESCPKDGAEPFSKEECKTCLFYKGNEQVFKDKVGMLTLLGE